MLTPPPPVPQEHPQEGEAAVRAFVSRRIYRLAFLHILVEFFIRVQQVADQSSSRAGYRIEVWWVHGGYHIQSRDVRRDRGGTVHGRRWGDGQRPRGAYSQAGVVQGRRPQARPRPRSRYRAAADMPEILHGRSLSLDRIDQLKDEFEKETGGERCTTFDVVSAIFWRCRTRAIGLRPDVDVRLTSSANVREFLRDKLLLPPEGGYYGNCFNLFLLKAAAGTISNASIFDIVRLVREAKGNVGAECSRWLEGIGGTPMPPFSYPNVFLTDWRRLGFFEADFGWGAPEYVVPLDQHPAIILNSPAPVKGVRLRTNCIAHQHFEAFRSDLSEYIVRN